jgi:hypothetical protein
MEFDRPVYEYLNNLLSLPKVDPATKWSLPATVVQWLNPGFSNNADQDDVVGLMMYLLDRGGIAAPDFHAPVLSSNAQRTCTLGFLRRRSADPAVPRCEHRRRSEVVKQVSLARIEQSRICEASSSATTSPHE